MTTPLKRKIKKLLVDVYDMDLERLAKDIEQDTIKFDKKDLIQEQQNSEPPAPEDNRASLEKDLEKSLERFYDPNRLDVRTALKIAESNLFSSNELNKLSSKPSKKKVVRKKNIRKKA